MSFGQLWIQLQSFAARSLRFVQIVLAAVPVHVKKRTAVRHAGIRTSVVGVNHDGAGEHLPGKVKTLAAKLMEELASSQVIDRKSTRLNSSHSQISYAVFCLKKKNKRHIIFSSDLEFFHSYTTSSRPLI